MKSWKVVLAFILVISFSVVAVVTPQAEIEIGDEPVPAFEKLLQALSPDGQAAPVAFGQSPEGPAEGVTESLLRHGTKVTRTDFPAVLKTDDGRCTAAIVGPETVLLAAHCMKGQPLAAFDIGGTRVEGVCRVPDNFSAKAKDWALCVLKNRVERLVYETLNKDVVPPPPTLLILMGFGCDEDGVFGDLRIGRARVDTITSDGIRIFVKGDVSADEGAAVCEGDSGGPAFHFVSDQTTSRRIVAVNVQPSDDGGSVLAALASPEARKFIDDFVQETNAKICGVNLPGTECR